MKVPLNKLKRIQYSQLSHVAAFQKFTPVEVHMNCSLSLSILSRRLAHPTRQDFTLLLYKMTSIIQEVGCYVVFPKLLNSSVLSPARKSNSSVETPLFTSDIHTAVCSKHVKFCETE